MNATTKATLLSNIERLDAVLGGMSDQDEVYNEDGQMYEDAQALTTMRDELKALTLDTSTEAKVLVSVSGGVADFVADGPVSVEVFDHDNYEADPEGTGLPSPEFESLARSVQSIEAHYTARERAEGSIQAREVTSIEGFSINVPEWFEDKAFLDWLNDPENTLFTWHSRGDDASDWSDVVVCVDPSLNGEGSESDMPEHIWDQIIALCKKRYKPSFGNHIHVRLTNLN